MNAQRTNNIGNPHIMQSNFMSMSNVQNISQINAGDAAAPYQSFKERYS